MTNIVKSEELFKGKNEHKIKDLPKLPKETLEVLVETKKVIMEGMVAAHKGGGVDIDQTANNITFDIYIAFQKLMCKCKVKNG